MPAIFIYVLLSVPFIGAYAMFALGISAIYRASRVLNLAHGAMAMIPAYLAYSLVKAGVPVLVALVLAVLAGAVLGVGVERLFVRRLRAQGPTAQTVGTVAVTGLLIALAVKIWGSTPLLAPKVFPSCLTCHFKVGSSGITYGQLGLFGVAVVVSLGAFAFFKYTDYGLAMRGAAQNRRAASLMGIDPDIAAAAAWALGGGMAALAGVLLAAVTNLDPFTLSLQVLPAFVAALIGGLDSLTGALWGSAIAGLCFGLVPYFSSTPVIGSIAGQSGSPQLALTVLVLIIMGVRGRRIAGADTGEAGLSVSASPTKPIRSRSIGRAMLATAVVIAIWPWIVPFSVVGTSVEMIELALVAASLVILTGWVGQISLAQASFVGIAALVTGMVSRGWGLQFPATTIIGALAAGVAAVLLGVVALRVRGLYLAVATLIFAWMCQAFLFPSSWLGASSGSSAIPPGGIGHRGAWPFLDLTDRRTLFYLFAGVIALVLFGLANLRNTKTGRAFFAVRGSEMAAASLGIDVVRTKLVAFAISGVVAGIAGNLIMVHQGTVEPGQFIFTVSLQYLAIAVVGGLGSLGGAVAAGAVFAGLDELFFRVTALAGWLDVVSAGLLAIVLLAYPGGLAALFESAGRAADVARRVGAGGRRAITARMDRRREKRAEKQAPRAPVERPRRTPRLQPAIARGLATALRPVRPLLRPLAARMTARRARAEGEAHADWYTEAMGNATLEEIVVAEPASTNGNGHHEPQQVLQLRPFEPADRATDRNARPAIVEARDIVVRFGGLTAVGGASLAVHQGEITGLIGPNGAGKTTLFNAILGLNSPTSGTVRLYGKDATALPPHQRAALGVARTFQVLQLFSELTVFENLLVATHLHNTSGVFSNLVASPRTLEAERDARMRSREILRLLELEDIAHQSVRGLPFGVLRTVELGRALVTGSRLIMLDEPASGLNNAETDRLAEIISGIRNLGVSVLLIEHDVRMVTGVCDYVYVLDQGRMIAEGPSDSVQRDPAVVAAYLGEPVEVAHA